MRTLLSQQRQPRRVDAGLRGSATAYIEGVFRIDETYAALADGSLALGDARIAALDERLVAGGIAAPFVVGAGAGREHGGQGGGQDESVSHRWVSLLRPGSTNRARIVIE